MSGGCILPPLWLPDSTGDLEVKIPLASQLLWALLVLWLVYLFSTNFKSFIITCLLITCRLSAQPLLQLCLQPWEAVDIQLCVLCVVFFFPQLSKKLLPEQSDSFHVFIFVLSTARGKALPTKAWIAALADVPSGSLAWDMSSCRREMWPCHPSEGEERWQRGHRVARDPFPLT